MHMTDTHTLTDWLVTVHWLSMPGTLYRFMSIQIEDSG
jgi:hypothetical protein